MNRLLTIIILISISAFFGSADNAFADGTLKVKVIHSDNSLADVNEFQSTGGISNTLGKYSLYESDGVTLVQPFHQAQTVNENPGFAFPIGPGNYIAKVLTSFSREEVSIPLTITDNTLTEAEITIQSGSLKVSVVHPDSSLADVNEFQSTGGISNTLGKYSLYESDGVTLARPFHQADTVNGNPGFIQPGIKPGNYILQIKRISDSSILSCPLIINDNALTHPKIILQTGQCFDNNIITSIDLARFQAYLWYSEKFNPTFWLDFGEQELQNISVTEIAQLDQFLPLLQMFAQSTIPPQGYLDLVEIVEDAYFFGSGFKASQVLAVLGTCPNLIPSSDAMFMGRPADLISSDILAINQLIQDDDLFGASAAIDNMLFILEHTRDSGIQHCKDNFSLADSGADFLSAYIDVTIQFLELQKLDLGTLDDNDGISDEIDTMPTVFSNSFADAATTFGEIINRGGQILEVSDLPDPDGISVFAKISGSGAPATVSFCNGADISDLDPGEIFFGKCSSVILEVISGSIFVTFNTGGIPATTTMTTGQSLTFDPENLTITTGPGTNIIVEIDGKEIPIRENQTVELDISSSSQPIGGEIIPIETTSLALAGVQSFSWIIPFVLSMAGITLLVVRRKLKHD